MIVTSLPILYDEVEKLAYDEAELARDPISDYRHFVTEMSADKIAACRFQETARG